MLVPATGLSEARSAKCPARGSGRVHEGRPRRQRLLEGGHRRQRLVVDVDQVERFSGRGVILGDHRCYRLSLVAGHLDGEDGAITERGTEVGLAPAEVLAGDARRARR